MKMIVTKTCYNRVVNKSLGVAAAVPPLGCHPGLLRRSGLGPRSLYALANAVGFSRLRTEGRVFPVCHAPLTGSRGRLYLYGYGPPCA